MDYLGYHLYRWQLDTLPCVYRQDSEYLQLVLWEDFSNNNVN